MLRKPTLKQKKFAEEYVANGGNGTQAALSVYDTVDAKTASVIAAENLVKPCIAGAIVGATETCKSTAMKALTLAIALAESELTSPDKHVRMDARKYLLEVGKLFAPANSMPKTAVQNNRFVYPKK